ncbi:MAG TPA: hypothetical protein VE988_18720, partial [Gemmataceae bacterium]|nr:hypothetical protein [Gemmataceae bacterium]
MDKRDLPSGGLSVAANVQVGAASDAGFGHLSESTIAIDPNDPCHLFAAATAPQSSGLFAAYSTNSGANWTPGIILILAGSLPAASSDQHAVFDDLGNLFLV